MIVSALVQTTDYSNVTFCITAYQYPFWLDEINPSHEVRLFWYFLVQFNYIHKRQNNPTGVTLQGTLRTRNCLVRQSQSYWRVLF